MICKHCGVPITYHPRDTVFLHDVLTWGSPNILAPDFNNGYYCTVKRTTSAMPKEDKSDTIRPSQEDK